VGIAPLYIRETRYYRALNLRQIEFLGTGEACSSYLDFIVQEKDRKLTIQMVYDFLSKEARKFWDILCLTEIPVESNSIDLLHKIARERGKVVEVPSHTCSPIVKLTGSVDSFLKGISGNERHNLKRRSKRLEELGRVEFYQAASNGDVQKEMDALVKLHQMRWQQKGFDGSFMSRKFLAFHKEVSEIFSKRGWLQLNFLIVNGARVAGSYCYGYKGVYSYYLAGLNPTISSKASLGRLFLFQCICLAIQHGYKELDLLQGPADYKMDWANSLRRSIALRLYNKGIRPAFFKMLESGKETIKILVR
jgi:hypothetical protein